MTTRDRRARLQQDERPEPQDAPDWLRKNGVTAAALTLIAIQLVWMAVLLAHSYFRQDDFRYLDRALANGLNWSYLMWVDAGHLLPLGFAVAWAMARISLYNWPLTSLFILALMAATCLARHHEDDPPHLIYFPEVRLPLEQLLTDIDRVLAAKQGG